MMSLKTVSLSDTLDIDSWFVNSDFLALISIGVKPISWGCQHGAGEREFHSEVQVWKSYGKFGRYC